MHWGSASGEKFKQTTSVERWLELAKTHPMAVGTWHACSRRKRPAYDERGRAVGGEQSEFGLSLSLAGSGKAFHVGMSTKDVDDEELVALWWCPHASGWSPREILAARRTRLDLREVDADEVFPPVGEDILEEDAGAAAAGAASGAPEGPPLRKIVQARGFDTDASLSGSNSSSSREVSESEAEARAESESSGSDAEGEDSRGAAAGALPSDLGGKSADDAAQTSNVRRRASFIHATRPAQMDTWLSSSNQKVKLRRKGILELLAVVNREAWRAPNPGKFATGIPHLLSGEKHKGNNFGVARAFATQKVHFFLGKLQTKLTGECVGSGRFFCEAFPNLEPASGGSPRVEAIDCHRPAWWGKLRDTWGVKTLHDFFLKHIWNKHDGEARPLRKKWAPTALDVDVCNPAFWSSQFMAEDETQQWLAARGKTPVLSRCNQAASGAFRCAIRAGPAVALAQMYYYGEPMCTAFDVYKPFHRPADPHPQGELSGKEEERSAASWCGVATCPWWSSSSPSSSPLSSSSASQSSSPSSSPSSVIAIASRHRRQRSVVVILIPNGHPPHHRRRHRRR